MISILVRKGFLSDTGTFHALCARFLRRHGARLGLAFNFTIADMEDVRRTVRELVDEHEAELASEGVALKADAVQHVISAAKSRGESPDMLRGTLTARTGRLSPSDSALVRLYEAYEARLRAANALDFDDLLLKGVQLFREHPDVTDHIRHVLVDEFQDTNTVQYLLMRYLAAATGHVSVVGDPDQSIYMWRNAEVGNLARMLDDFPGLQCVLLEENFRSTGAVLEAARAVMRQDTTRIDKDLYTSHARGAPVTLRTLSDADTEADYIALEIQRQVKCSLGLLTYADTCILLRFNALSRTFESALQRYGISYRVMGGARFFDRAEVRDLLAYLLLADNPQYTPGVVRVLNVPRRGIGVKTVQACLEQAQSRGMPLLALLEDIVDGQVLPPPALRGAAIKSIGSFVDVVRQMRSLARDHVVSHLLQVLVKVLDYETHLKREPNWESRWENVQELISFATAAEKTHEANTDTAASLVDLDVPSASKRRRMEKGEVLPDMRSTFVPETDAPTPLRTFLESSALASDVNTTDDDAPKVTITTCHAAKGLEWPLVFIPAVEDGTFPFYRCQKLEEVREERRLLYVAMTRAETNLYLTCARRRLVAGEWSNRHLSPFVKSLASGALAPCARVDWCYTLPPLNAQLQSVVADVLQRPLAPQEALDEYRREYELSHVCRRLKELDAERGMDVNMGESVGWVRHGPQTSFARTSLSSPKLGSLSEHTPSSGSVSRLRGFSSALNTISGAALDHRAATDGHVRAPAPRMDLARRPNAPRGRTLGMARPRPILFKKRE